ncbi:type III secretion system ATPase, FliI/YscN [Lutispora thermophila DSM 19022]|uniref:Type 3 secretion system ATPase n=1 Tax=Lutispora thermophila DSM 19022 TaxID=1122184 RepID=A0A1M6G6R4_9FIRM|nr:type III secretion system ATPase, FliI/YscN [Lutispora thermophila DSM 19022]
MIALTKLNLSKYKKIVETKDFVRYSGRVSQVVGLTIESVGPAVNLNELCSIVNIKNKNPILAEVVGFKGNTVSLMPLGSLDGIGPGSQVVATGKSMHINVSNDLLGRVLDGLGQPIDGKGPIESNSLYSIYNEPPDPLLRKIIDTPLSLGVKAIDGMLTIGKGQRVGIFAGSGVGKSTLLGMIARNTTADINVICLIGERGREVNEFIKNDLQDEGLSRSVLVVATSDQPPLIRLKSAYVATTIAEYFRDQGKDVLLMMDSLTRFAMAQREIGLSIGEPPVSRGFTPSVFSVLPKLLERTGTSDKGSITAFYTVLVDGDDMNEPITDAVRGILDGHIVLSRLLANRNHYPSIDVLASISRLMPNIVSDHHKELANEIKKLLSIYKDSEDLINIGAYQKGSNKKIDFAIEKIDSINQFLTQSTKEKVSFDDTIRIMENILS